MVRIIGLTGTLGAGKGTVVDYLVGRHGFTHFSARSFLTSVIEERGMPVNRDSMVAVANELREQHGPSAVVERLFEKAAAAKAENVIIESIRTVGEVESLRAKGAAASFVLLAVDADPAVRYQRVVGRGSATDKVTLEKFKEDEQREMTSDDPTKQNLAACIALADVRLLNNGAVAELEGAVEAALALGGDERD